MIILEGSPHRRSEPDFWFSIWGRRGCPPGGAPKIEVHTNTLNLVSIASSRCLLFSWNILLENRPSWGPGEPPNAPQGAPPKSKFIEIHWVWCLSLRLDAYCSAETFFWRTDPHGARGSPQMPPGGAPKIEVHKSTSVNSRFNGLRPLQRSKVIDHIFWL